MSSEPTRDAYQGDVDKRSSTWIEGIEYGTIGWANNPNVMDIGTGGDSTSEAGATLFRVTLYRGRLPGGEPQVGVAEGLQIIAHFIGPLFVPFAAGQRVVISWPERYPGAPALILGTVGASPATKFAAATAVLACAGLVLGDPSQGSGLVEITPTAINLGDAPDDAPAAASIVDANFKAITDYITTVFGSPSLVLAPAGTLGGPCTIATPAPSTNATKSNFVSMKK